MPFPPKKPSLVSEANEKLEAVRKALAWAFDVASLEGDEWSSSAITAARRVLGDDATQTKLVIQPRARVRRR